MSADPWSRLAAPFPMTALAWNVLARSEDRTRLRLSPRVSAPFLRRRLDDVVGPGGWSLRLRAWGDDGLIAELTVAGATRGAAERGASAGAAGSGGDAPGEAGAEVGEAAFSAAAAGFGMLPPVEVTDDGWVDADPETDEPLHPPETRPRGPGGGAGAPSPSASGPADGSGVPSAGGGIGGEVEERGPAWTPPAERSPAEDAPERPAGGPQPSGGPGGEADRRADEARPGEAPSAQAPAAGDRLDGSPEGKPEAHRVIDRLVERLREEGLGAAAAKLVLSYGGYGQDPERSRELYARLRTLLIERGTHA